MPGFESILVWLLFNALVGLLLVLCAWGLQRVQKLPSNWVHTIWLLVLVRMIAPPIPDWVGAMGSAVAAPPPTLIESGAPAYQRELVDWMTQTFGNNWSGGMVALLFTVWALGCVFVVVRVVMRERKLWDGVSAGAASDPALDRRVREVAARIRLKGALPDVRVLSGIDSPFLWSPLSSLGRRAFCIVPAHIAELPNSVLAHELLHLKRRDHWVAWAEFAALVLFLVESAGSLRAAPTASDG
jgi:beta-lactamase regulating signal transducer with metallopeptidase domain